MKSGWAYQLHQGLVRDNQEDAVAFWPDRKTKKLPRLLVVADGVGGQPDGEIASKTSVDAMYDYVRKRDGLETPRGLIQAVKAADRTLLKKNKKRAPTEYMATTLTATYFQQDALWMAHIGDCRLYQIQEGHIRQLSTDHAVNQHTLERALGFNEHPEIDFTEIATARGDNYLLCSDGLHGAVKDEELLKIILGEENLSVCVDQLVRRALDQGGNDNIAVILIRV